MFRHWRIQVSLICFALLVAVIMFWVRSYSWFDQGCRTNKSGSSLWVVSTLGGVLFVSRESNAGLPPMGLGWRVTCDPITPDMKDGVYLFRQLHRIGFLGFVAFSESNVIYNAIYIGVPYWFLSILFALLCGLPWYWRRFNFSLRTFLIAFTVFAVLLGFIGWLVRLATSK